MKQSRNRHLRIGILLLLTFVYVTIIKAQPYYNTQVESIIVKQNSFIKAIVDSSNVPTFKEVKKQLPQPFWDNNPSAVSCYWKAWEIAFSNLKSGNNSNKFISSYIDPAFNGSIFMWDCSFMTMFGKYGNKVFDFQSTLDNFYSKQHKDGYICREIRSSDGSDVFQKFDISSTGPNIMPWSEWEYFLNFNDTERLEKVFPVLLAYYNWYKTYRAWPDGSYFSSGWGCGMDNQPRMHEQYNEAWSHGFMSWIDITLQEIYAGKILIEMSKVLGKKNEIVTVQNNVDLLTSYVNTKMWDEQEQFYFDRFRDGTLSEVKSIASFWAYLAGVIPENRLEGFTAHLTNPTEFARKHRVPTLSADSPHFDPEGDYWNGSVWAPTNYMVLRGLTKYGKDSLAYIIAANHLDNVVEVFKHSNTLHENYAPDKVQGNDKKDFVGWTGLVPINVLFEYVFGIRPNVPENKLVIDVNLLDSYGVFQYPYGHEGLLNISCKKRKGKFVRPEIKIESNVSLTVVVKWDGGVYSTRVSPGRNYLK